ncbi:MAG: transketolase, partial [Bdellovibrionaceae bacterium]|nr:transketolase [Pseudobdellovibrionaceae bacterium]
VAVGMALGAKIKKTNQKVYCIVGDGESNGGAIWEALLFAAHWRLNNLFVIFDCNGYQAMGATEDIMNLNSMKKMLLYAP